MAASGLASLSEFDIEQIEDIKLAVSEVFVALVEHGESRIIDIELLAYESSFTVRGSTSVSVFDVNHPDLALCRTVLTSVCADNGIEFENGTVQIYATVLRPSAN